MPGINGKYKRRRRYVKKLSNKLPSHIKKITDTLYKNTETGELIKMVKTSFNSFFYNSDDSKKKED